MSRWRFLVLICCGLLLLALTGAGLAVQRRQGLETFVAVALAQGVVYVTAIALLRKNPPRRAVPLVLVIALAMRIAVLFAPPSLSNDVYRYVWDGRVIAAGINPYRYIPADPRLAALRDAVIFPNINRRDYARTIYPPAAEAIFFVVTRLGGAVTGMKAAMVLLEAIAVTLMLRLLQSSGQPSARIAIYAWHPLPLWEFAGSGHIDAAVVALVALALWTSRREARWPTGIALAAATLVKFYPAAIFPALWRRWDWRMPAAFAVAVVVAYLPFLAVGWRVFGFLPHYLAEEGFSGAGSGFYLWDLAKAMLPLDGVPEAAYLAIAAVLGGGIAAWLALRRRATDGEFRGAALLAASFMVLLSPHYPWYFAWLVVFACLLPSAALVWLTLASFLLYLVPVWPELMGSASWLLVQTIAYGPFLLLAVAEWWWRRRRKQAEHGERAFPC